MKITANTKIAALLRQNPDSLDAIISINQKFEKLRNPLLRKLMAGRTSLAQAAKIGQVPVDRFFEVLAPLGFEADISVLADDNGPGDVQRPDWLMHANPDRIRPLDVRPMLAHNKDPLQLIMQALQHLPPGYILQLINSFEPTPLISLLEKKGYNSFVEWPDNNVVHTFLYLPTLQKKSQPSAPLLQNDFETCLDNFKNNLVELDVRALEMPLPMLTILEELEQLPKEKALYVFHKRVPVYLLDELKTKEFEYRLKEIQPGEVHLLIWKTE